MSLRILDARLQIGNGSQDLSVEIPSLDLRLGTCTALTGPSGSGKTSVLELAALMQLPSNLGAFDIAGIDVRKLSLAGSLDARAAFRASHISFTVQSGGVLPFLTAEENALAGLRVSGKAVDEVTKERLHSIARDLGVLDALPKYRKQLSGGERRRVGLIRSLLSPRQLVLADEPTSALDDNNARIVFRLLSELAHLQGVTVLIATHDEQRAQAAGFTIHEMTHSAGGHRVSAKRGGVCREH